MPRIDLSLSELWELREDLPEPPGLDSFWHGTLAEAAGVPLDVRLERVPSILPGVVTHDVTYAGFGGAPIRAWLHLPAAALRDEAPLAGVVQYQGYNGGRGLPHEHTFWAQAGFAHLVMDTRGQGSGWTTGDTADPAAAGPAQGGFLTRGIERPEDHFYRRVFVDAVRAVAVLRAHPEVDPTSVAVTGHSQGGGIATAVASLSPEVAAAMPDVPFLAHFRRAVDLSPGDPYAEVARYLGAHRDRTEQVFATLAHFDAAVLARRASAPALFSVAMMDSICLPSTVFAAYHAYAGPKDIAVYEFNDHEGGGAFHSARQVDWLRATLA
ncbi:acetylxylan esterase [Nocardioides sp. BP30]|uniref:acetylxylan esterase n=1 Tax=Nocardioides sp. BP30 TaxID=3036374 RepID=UPI0024692EFC|nr:acetylxylan esterase [Nocardioides sp. BP30]WGL50900.1 acetylxylan esterase [Nocardioides sp. BP30]